MLQPIHSNTQMHDKMRPCQQQGLTLMELLVCLLLLSGAVSALVKLQTHALRVSQQNLWRQQAMHLSQVGIANLWLSNQQEAAWLQPLQAAAARNLPNGQVSFTPCPESVAHCLRVLWTQSDATECSDSQVHCVWLEVAAS